MSIFLATTTAKVLRGVTTNSLGDEVAGVAVVLGLEAVAVSIVEKARKVYDSASGELRTVRYVVGRAQAGTPVVEGDRLLDNRTLKTYTVDAVTGGERNIAGAQPLVFDLRQL